MKKGKKDATFSLVQQTKALPFIHRRHKKVTRRKHDHFDVNTQSAPLLADEKVMNFKRIKMIPVRKNSTCESVDSA